MNILFLDQFSDLGGAQQCLLDLMPAIRERGWQAIVAAPSGGSLLDRCRAEGAVVEHLRQAAYGMGRKSAMDFARFALELPRLGSAIGRLMEQHRPSLVYVNGPRVAPAAAWAKSEAPVIFHSHSFLPQSYAQVLTGSALRRLKATVIASCRFTGDPWKRYVGSENVHIVYNGVKELPWCARPMRNPARIGVLGRIAPEKGQAVFVRAAKLLASEGCRLHFVVTGASLFEDPAGTVYFREVQAAAAGSPIEFRGWEDDAGAALAELDLLAVPSLGPEATTRVILEAWAAGVPVLASRVGGIAEIVDDGETGFLVEPDSAAALASRIREVLSLPADRLRFVAEAARAAYEERFTLSKYRDQVLNLLARVAGKQARHE